MNALFLCFVFIPEPPDELGQMMSLDIRETWGTWAVRVLFLPWHLILVEQICEEHRHPEGWGTADLDKSTLLSVRISTDKLQSLPSGVGARSKRARVEKQAYFFRRVSDNFSPTTYMVFLALRARFSSCHEISRTKRYFPLT